MRTKIMFKVYCTIVVHTLTDKGTDYYGSFGFLESMDRKKAYFRVEMHEGKHCNRLVSFPRSHYRWCIFPLSDNDLVDFSAVMCTINDN